MPLQATSGAASQDAFGGNGVPVVPTYIEDVFSTYLYKGNSPTGQSINNGIDLSTKGGLIWFKGRDIAAGHSLYNTTSGITKYLATNTDLAEQSNGAGDRLTAFNTNGFSLGTDPGSIINNSSYNYTSWTFRKQPKFFDIVTYTGTGVARTVAHNLGSVPGCIIVKRTDNVAAWQVYHVATGNGNSTVLNDALRTGATNFWNNTSPTSTDFSVNTQSPINASGATYVAYLFAHNAGGFGLTGTDNVISCGSFTNNGSGNATVSLGYEPQWVLIKDITNPEDWYVNDIMRGMPTPAANKYLIPNTSGAEGTGSAIAPTSTGFAITGLAASDTYIYIAIRRGPMKVPTTGTSVFSPQIYTEIVTNPTTLTTSFATDLHMISRRTGTTTFYVADRLRGSVLGNENLLETSSTAAETDYSSSPPLFTSNTGIVITNLFNNISSQTDVSYQFRQAPSFMDVVCYTGAGTSATTFSHNLQKQPELIIVKSRNATNNWAVAAQTTGSNYIWGLDLNTTAASQSPYDYGANMSATIFDAYIGTAAETVNSGTTYVAYLFATCAGVSKVGSYTGTGTTKQIDCGFTAGARFVLIKRTDSTGDWYVWDTARGIVSGNDPYLLLNSTAAEVTSTDYIDTYSAGFEISSTAPAAINASAGTFIFLAIA